jgi:DNA-binding Xre family transcriptional regulator
MAIKRVQKKIDWTPEDRQRHKAIRETFKDRPSIDELIARGELSGQPVSLGAYVNLRVLVQSLRPMREQAQLSLSELSQRSGMDKAMLSRLENGHVPNPGIETISRYVNALDQEIEWRLVAGPKKPKPKVGA